MRRPPKDRALLHAKLAALRERGVSPTADDILDLHTACVRVVSPHASTPAIDLFDTPTLCGSLNAPIKLWTHSLASAAWLSDYAEGWFSNEIRLWITAIAFAHAHAREAIFSSLTNRADALRAMLDWSLSITATPAELIEGINAVTSTSAERPAAEAKESASAVARFRTIISDLETTSGIPSDVWLYHRSASAVCSAWSRAIRRHASAFSPSSLVEDDHDPEAEAALQNLQQVFCRILERHGVEVIR